MNNLNTTEEELMTAENQYWIDQKEALERLHQNEDFKLVILEGYFKDKAINGVSLLARDQIVDAGKRSAVMEDLIGVSSLEDHFVTIYSLGTIPEDDEE